MGMSVGWKSKENQKNITYVPLAQIPSGSPTPQKKKRKKKLDFAACSHAIKFETWNGKENMYPHSISAVASAYSPESARRPCPQPSSSDPSTSPRPASGARPHCSVECGPRSSLPDRWDQSLALRLAAARNHGCRLRSRVRWSRFPRRVGLVFLNPCFGLLMARGWCSAGVRGGWGKGEFNDWAVVVARLDAGAFASFLFLYSVLLLHFCLGAGE